MDENAKSAFLIASNFVILPQFVICSCTYLHLRSICGTGNSSQQIALQHLSTTNMVFSDEEKILIKSLYLKGYTAKRLTDEFPETSWTKYGVNIEENSYAIICFNILNILLTHKYTRLTRAEELKLVHLKCNMFAFSSISAEYLQKII